MSLFALSFHLMCLNISINFLVYNCYMDSGGGGSSCNCEINKEKYVIGISITIIINN